MRIIKRLKKEEEEEEKVKKCLKVFVSFRHKVVDGITSIGSLVAFLYFVASSSKDFIYPFLFWGPQSLTRRSQVSKATGIPGYWNAVKSFNRV